MKPESLIQLIGSGNTTTVDEEWMRLLEAPDLPLARFVGYRDVLAELCRVGKASQAEELAWAAVEAISMRHTPLDAITVAIAKRFDPGRQCRRRLINMLVQPELDSRPPVSGRFEQSEQNVSIIFPDVGGEPKSVDKRNLKSDFSRMIIPRTRHCANSLFCRI